MRTRTVTLRAEDGIRVRISYRLGIGTYVGAPLPECDEGFEEDDWLSLDT